MKLATGTELAFSKLTPYRVTDLPDRTIYEFWKIGSKTGGRRIFSDPDVAKQLAYICYIKSSNTFQLGYFPNEGEPQVVKNLPLTDLPQAVADLIAAGF